MSLARSVRAKLAAIPLAALFALFSAFSGALPASAAVLEDFGAIVTAPSAGGTVSGTFTFTGHASADLSAGSFTLVSDAGPINLTAEHADGNLRDWRATWNSTVAPNGSYSVTFQATRASDAARTTSPAVAFNVANGGGGAAGFTVSVTAPTEGATLTGTVGFSATTSGSADSLSFILSSGTGSIISVPATGSGTTWTASWDSTAAANGTYGLKARAFHSGIMDESGPRPVTVSNAAPMMTVTLDAPTAGSTVSGLVPLAATTNLSATGLGFAIRNAAGALVATVSATSAGGGTNWTASWDSTAHANGTFAIRAVASKDGVSTESTVASVTVSNEVAPPPPAPVTVTLVAPTGGATVSGSVALSATTSVSVDSLAFIVTQAFGEHQAVVIPASGSGTSWTASWASGAATNGNYGIVARATKNGADANSAVTTVTLSNVSNTTPPPSPTPAPAPLSVAVTSPSAGVTLSGTTTLVASTSLAASSLTFVLREAAHPDVVAATASATGSAGSTVWTATVNTATVANGTYGIVARATKDGVVTPSEPVNVTVSNAAPAPGSPVEFSVTLPVADATLTGSAVLSATANQPLDGFTFTVTGTTPGAAPITIPATGNATRTVWNAPWDTRSVPNGEYDLGTTAVKAGANTAGATRRFRVSNASVTVTITSPSNNAEVSGNKEVLVAVGATMASVSVKITSTTNAALTSTRNAVFDAARQVWVVAWNTTDFANGTYRIEAKAVDAQAHELIAAPITVRVANAATTPAATQFSVKVVAPVAGATVKGTIGLAAAVVGEATTVQFFMSPLAGEIRRADAHFDTLKKLWVASWNTAENPNGGYAIGAVAVNSSNAKAESDKVQVTVSNAAIAPPPAPAAFSARLVEPAGGNVAGKVRFVAQTEGAAGVRFFVKYKGTTIQRVLTGVPDAAHVVWTAEWDTAPEAAGTYDAVAVAKNAAGAEASSNIVTLFIERIGEPAPAPAPAPGETRPAIVILRPVAEAVLHGAVGLVAGAPNAAKVRFAALAADGKAVFARDAVKGDLGWSVLWDTSAVPDARYRIEAVALSSTGERLGAASIGVAVANAAPRPVSAPIEVVPVEAVKEAIHEVPAGVTMLAPERMPQEATDAAAKLNEECAANGIPPERCPSWLANRPEAAACRAAGIITKEECVAWLRQRHGGEVPACQGRSAEACGEEIARVTAGLLDSSTLRAMKETVEPHIGQVLRVPPRVELAEPDGTAPVPGDGVGKESPPAMTDLMPFANHRRMAVRVHASPSFATSDETDTAHESMSAVLFVDTDGDALPDDVEKRFGTDPGNADTDGDGFDDGTEVSKGYNPLGKGRIADSGRSLAPVDVAIVSGMPIEQPRSAGRLRSDLQVDAAGTREGSGGMVLRGRGKPGEVVTVFVYSYLPVVFTTTVKDDGTWEYDLGSELTDGEHEVYATVTDDTGKIQEKSSPLSFFVAEAQAVEEDEFFQPVEESPVASAKVQAPVKQTAGMYLVGGGVLIAFALLLSYMLFMRPRKSDLPPPPS